MRLEHVRQNLILQLQKKCMFCLTKKYLIIFSTKNMLNKRSELVTKRRDEDKFRISFTSKITKTYHYHCLLNTFFPKRLGNMFYT